MYFCDMLILAMNMRIILMCAMFFLTSDAVKAQQLKLNEKNVEQIVQAMTFEEKARLLVGVPQTLVNGAAGATAGFPQYGIPMTILTDGPAGVRIDWKREGDPNSYHATAFPIGSCLAASWNVDLARQIGVAMGNETKEFGCDVLLAPGMNIHRNPLCGRNFEYFSEDPILTGKMAAAVVNGVQSVGVGTSIKHFAVNSQEDARMSVNEIVSQRALREIYLKGFEIAVKEAEPWTVMSSYNRLNGSFTQENRELLTTLLRDEWGYRGMVMTDWTDTRNTVAQVYAGNDLMEPGHNDQVQQIIDGVKNGKLSVEDVDRNAKRILEYVLKTPTYHGYKYSNKPNLKAHAALVRSGAPEGMVLLKNENMALPLNNIRTAALFGSSSYRSMSCGLGSGTVNPDHVVNIVDGLSAAGITCTSDLQTLYDQKRQFEDTRHRMERGDDYDWKPGRVQYSEFELSNDAIRAQADRSDVAIFTIGREAGEGGDRSVDGRSGFNLTDMEVRQLKNVCREFHAAGKKVIVIINSGSVIQTTNWKDDPDAILLVWQPGEECGNSVADVLTGKVNPSGKLPMTWVENVKDHPSTKNFPMKDGTNLKESFHKEGIDVGYRYFNTVKKKVSYPFGFGLSYTKFSYTKPEVKTTKDGFRATIVVTNIGDKSGKDIVQLYVSAPKGMLEKPANELKAFAKTRLLKPGEKQILIFNVANYDLASFNETVCQWVSDKGTYTVKFGASVEDIRAEAKYKLNKVFIKKVNDILKPDKAI